MRIVVLLFACLGLAACNLVTSRTPLISSRQPPILFKDGLWMRQGADCVFDTAKPAKAWPGCAEAFVVEGNKVRDLQGRRAADTLRYRIAPGEPWLIQATIGVGPKRALVYLAAEPERTPGGRIIALTGWPVVCGPLTKGQAVSDPPFSGLTLQPRRKPTGCAAPNLETLRQAARLSKSVSEHSALHWVRAAP